MGMRMAIFLVGLIGICCGFSTDCLYVGVFPYDGTNCKNYTICAWNGREIVKNNYVCPTTTVFNPLIQKCSGTFKCVDYICKKSSIDKSGPIFYNPNSNDCSTFVRCVSKDSSDTELYPIFGRCPSGLYLPQDTVCIDPLSGFADVTTACISKKPCSC